MLELEEGVLETTEAAAEEAILAAEEAILDGVGIDDAEIDEWWLDEMDRLSLEAVCVPPLQPLIKRLALTSPLIIKILGFKFSAIERAI